MRRIVSFFSALLVCAPLFGDQSEISDFERRAQSLGQSISSENSPKSSRCEQLVRDMEQLRGRPQLRYTVRQEYMQECYQDESNATGIREPIDDL